MTRDGHRRGRLLTTAGILLAVVSIVVLIIVGPGAERGAGTVRLVAVFGFSAGIVVAVSGVLPARKPPSVWRSRWYGALLLAVGCVNLLAGWMGGADRGWLSAAVGIAAVVGGIGVLIAARRRPRPEPSP